MKPLSITWSFLRKKLCDLKKLDIFHQELSTWKLSQVEDFRVKAAHKLIRLEIQRDVQQDRLQDRVPVDLGSIH